MMKKSVATFFALGVLALGLAAPTFAQQSQPSGNQGGFFGMFVHFFSTMFHPGAQQTPGQNEQGGDQNNPSGTTSAVPSGAPAQGDANRLQGLVTAGKITSAQEQEILTEVNKIKSEISSWSQSTGLDAGYVYGGLRGPGMSAGIGGQGQGVSPTGQAGLQGGQGGQGGSGRTGFPGGRMGPRGNQQP